MAAVADGRGPEPGSEPGPGEGAAREGTSRSAAGGGATSPDRVPEREEASIPSSELERVIRRAAELQSASGESRSDFLDSGEIVRIGREVGIEERHLRQALAEVQADALLPEAPRDAALALRLWGEGFVRASRTVPGRPGRVQARIEAHFRERESLAEIRRRSGRSLWRPSTGLASRMQRKLDLTGRSYDLAEVRQVELAVTGLEPEWSLVSVTADLSNLRGRYLAGWLAGGLVSFSAVAAAAALSFAMPVVLPLLAAGGATVGATVWGVGFNMRRQKERIQLAIEGLLDRLEQGGSLEPERPSLREKFLGRS